MANYTGPVRRKQNRNLGCELFIEPEAGDQERINRKRERFLDFLSIRYGYSNLESVDELTRLRREFTRLNTILSIRRRRLAYVHLQAGQPETKSS